jgi:hypothetical protein
MGVLRPCGFCFVVAGRARRPTREREEKTRDEGKGEANTKKEYNTLMEGTEEKQAGATTRLKQRRGGGRERATAIAGRPLSLSARAKTGASFSPLLSVSLNPRKKKANARKKKQNARSDA